MSRTEMREYAFKLVYSLEVQKPENMEEQIDIYIEQIGVKKQEIIEYIKDIALGIEQYKEDIENIITACLVPKWTIDRVSKINISILRLAIYEIKYKDIPFKAEINEAVKLAKKYGEESSGKFINGALAVAVKQLNII